MKFLKAESNRRRRREHGFLGSTRLDLDRLLWQLLDAGLVGCLMIVPFVMGGRQAFGRLVLTGCVGLSAISWLILRSRSHSQGWRWTRLELVLIAAVGLVTAQTIHLPTNLLQTVSEAQNDLLLTWTPGSELGLWTTISLVPSRTLDGLVILLDYVILFVVLVNRVENSDDAARVFRWIGISGALMGVFALLQFALSNGRFFWIYNHPFSDTNDAIKGAFTNRNHFAHFMALSLGPLIWWTVEGSSGRRDRGLRHGHAFRTDRAGTNGFPLVAVFIVIFTGLTSLSRGGAFAIGCAALICLVAFYRAGRIGIRSFGGFCLVAVALSLILGLFGGTALDARFNTLVSGDLEQIDRDQGRRTIWQAAWKGIRTFPVVGTGIGSHRDVYPVFDEHATQRVEFTHAENGFLQIGLETGWAGILLLFLLLSFAVAWMVPMMRREARGRDFAMAAAAFAGLGASVVHSCGDFVWYVPGCMVVTIALLAILCRVYQWSHPDPDRFLLRMSPVSWRLLLAISVPIISLMLWRGWNPIHAESAWHAYQKSLQFRVENSEFADSSDTEVGIETDIRILAECIEADPAHSRAHAQLAILYAAQFEVIQLGSENRMSSAQIRDAVHSAGFESRDELDDWLQRAIGDHVELLRMARRHAMKSVQSCPLRGEAYVQLADLGFVDGRSREQAGRYLQQARSVRPHDAYVLYQSGCHAWLEGLGQQAIDFWQEAFHRDPLYQEKIFDLVVEQVSAAEILRLFEPSWPALRLLIHRYDESNPDHRIVLSALAEACRVHGELVSNPLRVQALLEGYHAYTRLGKRRSGLQCLIAAIKLDPMAYEPRYAIAAWFYHQGRYSEALDHLQWCALQRPDDQSVQKLIDKAATARLTGPGSVHSADLSDEREVH